MRKIMTSIGILLVFSSCSTSVVTNNELYKLNDTVEDMEGNTYRIVSIGKQTWMAENLRSTKFQDGSVVATGYIPDDEDENLLIYGRLYNWSDATDDRKICPLDWRVPTDEDWKELERKVGIPEEQLNNTGWRGNDDSAMTLKESHPDTLFSKFDQTQVNKYNFFVRAAGIKWKSCYLSQGMHAEFWTSSEATEDKAYNRTFAHSCWNWNKGKIYRNTLSKEYMFSVRCIKN